MRRLFFAVVAAALIAAPLRPPATLSAATTAVYTDALGAGWIDWTENISHNLAASSPVHSGSRSISVAFAHWEGLYLHHPGLGTSGYTALRFFVNGGSGGAHRWQISATHLVGASNVWSVTPFTLPNPAGSTWTAIDVPLSALDAANATLTGLIWEDASGAAQPYTFYLDDVALVGSESPDGPVLADGSVSPGAALAGGSTAVTVSVHVTDPQGPGDIAAVTLDATALGRGTVPLGLDATGRHSATFTVPATAAVGENTLWVTARDHTGHQTSLSLGAFVTLGAPGGRIPSALPQRLGFGTNQWSEASGQDWQVSSGVPWDYVYTAINYDWYADGWGGDFVGRFTRQAWAKSYVPFVQVYIMLEVPPVCQDGPTTAAACYAQKLQTPSVVSTYLAALGEAARQARGDHPVIFQLEPDFYGYMQSRLYATGSASPDDPAAYPVALNVSGYPNNLAGFGRRMVDVIHAAAPNALVAPHASMWATGDDIQALSVPQVISDAQRTAAFIDAMGGAQADALAAEWSVQDSGYDPVRYPFWDETNQTLPRHSRAVLWDNALSTAARKRVILWQMPCGNMSLDNTCRRYRDNRAAYVFRHAADLDAAGIFGVLFGGDTTLPCITQPNTDGGFIRMQAGLFYGVLHLHPAAFLPHILRNRP